MTDLSDRHCSLMLFRVPHCLTKQPECDSQDRITVHFEFTTGGCMTKAFVVLFIACALLIAFQCMFHLVRKHSKRMCMMRFVRPMHVSHR